MEQEDIIVGMQLGTEEIFEAKAQFGEIYVGQLDDQDLDEASAWAIPPGTHDGPFPWVDVAKEYGHYSSHHMLGLSYDGELFAAMHLHTSGKVIDLQLLACNYKAVAPWKGLTIPSVFTGVQKIAWSTGTNLQLQFWVSQPAEMLVSHYREKAESAKLTFLDFTDHVLKFKT